MGVDQSARISKIVIAIATVFLLSGSAWGAELPNYMLGYWCFNKTATRTLEGYLEDGTDKRAIYSRARGFDDCGNRGGMRLWRKSNRSIGHTLGRFEWRENCKIEKIKRIKAGTYLLETSCNDFELSRPSSRAMSEATERPEDTLYWLDRD
jgi:hypothetical protein